MGQIAGRLHLGVKTVETHRSHIKAKLKLATVADVVRRAVSWVDGHA
jgi:DNA-binding CsgD family transcriptional regulator